MNKKWWKSDTIKVFSAVLVGGGLDLITVYVQTGDFSWRSLVLLAVGLVGIGLRLKTKTAISK